jgi:hypothetical protein
VTDNFTDPAFLRERAKDIPDLFERRVIQDGRVAENMIRLLHACADKIEQLEAECFSLSAGVCQYRGGDEHGNPLCLKTGVGIT